MDPKAQANVDAPGGAPIVDCGADVERLFAVLQQPERVQILLPRWLRAQRWFAGKAREIRAATLLVAVPLSEHSVFCVMRVQYAIGEPQDYAVPLCWLRQDSDSPTLGPATVLARTTNPDGYLCDATADARFHDELFGAIATAAQFEAEQARLVGMPSTKMRRTEGQPSFVMVQEQSNTSIRFGDRHVLKLFRKLEPGLHPDVEMARFLGREPRFPHVAALHGTLELHLPQAASETSDARPQSTTLAMLSQWIPNAEDAWVRVVALAESDLGRTAAHAGGIGSGSPAVGKNTLAPSAKSRRLAEYLGRRTAQLHARLAAAHDDPEFAPERMDSADRTALLEGLRRQAYATRVLLQDERPRIPERWRVHVDRLLDEPALLLERFEPLRARDVDVVRIRCHGDFHLGQVLYLEDAKGKPDFVFLDFEGEPARPLHWRRAKSCALRDVAGMLRSLDYAAWMAHRRLWAGGDVTDATQETATSVWAAAMGNAFLQGYRDALHATTGDAEHAAAVHLVPTDAADFARLLDVFLFEKAMYELGYELNHRPDWVDIPLRGVAAALGETGTT